MAAPSIPAGQVTLTWDPPIANTDASDYIDPKTYKIYYGTSTGVYSDSIDLSTVAGYELATEYTITGLTESTTYYCAVSAIDADGNESSKSSEVSLVAAAASTPSEPTWTHTIVQTDLPYTITASGDYKIGENLTQGSGDAITVNAGLTVTLYGGNNFYGDGAATTFTYANTGTGNAIVVTSGSTIEVYGVDFQRGAAVGSSGCDCMRTTGTYGSGSSFHDNTIDNGSKNYCFGVRANTSLNNIRVYNNTMTVDSVTVNNSVALTYGNATTLAARARVYDNTITFTNCSAYTGLCDFPGYLEAYGNTINTNSTDEWVNGWQGWNNHYCWIHNNTCNFLGQHSRIFNPDGGSSYWWIHYNNVTMTDDGSGAGASRAVRHRYGSHDHSIGYNTLDCDGDTSAYCVSFGGNDLSNVNPAYNVWVYNNTMYSQASCLEIYGGDSANDYNLFLWGNSLYSTGDSIVQTGAAGTYVATGVEFNNDTLTGTVTINYSTLAPDWRVYLDFAVGDVIGGDTTNMTFPGTASYPVSNTPNAPTGLAAS